MGKRLQTLKRATSSVARFDSVRFLNGTVRSVNGKVRLCGWFGSFCEQYCSLFTRYAFLKIDARVVNGFCAL